MATYLRLYEDILAGTAGEVRLPALPRMIFVVHGAATIEGQTLPDGEAWAGEGAAFSEANKLTSKPGATEKDDRSTSGSS